MNPYDKAYELAEALRLQADTQQMKKLKIRIQNNAAAKVMMDDFFERQQTLMKLYQSGVVPDQAKMDEVEKLMQIMSGNSLCNEYIELEMRIAEMMNDIQKILSEAVKEATWLNQ